MKTEEKARAYDEAIKKAAALYKASEPMSGCNVIIETLFPELAESEDEKIRREIINYFKCQTRDEPSRKDTHNKWISWLEKQGQVKESTISQHENRTCEENDDSLTNEDEKIRKELIKHLKELSDWKEDEVIPVKNPSYYRQWASWLEKQDEKKPAFEMKTAEESLCIDSDTYNKIVDECIFDEQNDSCVKDYNNIDPHFGKSIDKTESKFKVGDWVVDKNGIVKQILSYKDGVYKHTDGYSAKIFEEEWRLWDITKDAKNGDVLICKGNIKNSNGIKYERICLFNNLDNAFFTLTKTSNFVEEYNIDVNIDYPDNTVPATKEQKEILFMAMKDAGYEFDFEDKKLKKIEPKTKENKGNLGEVSPNPAWSEEDERNLQGVIDEIEANKNEAPDHDLATYDRFLSWLKSLQDRVQPQSKQEWSEDDDWTTTKIMKVLLGSKIFLTPEETNELVYWIKSIKDRVQPKPMCKFGDTELTQEELCEGLIRGMVNEHNRVTKEVLRTEYEKGRADAIAEMQKEWSDVDKDILFCIINDLKFLRDTISIDPKYAVNIIDMEREITWLKSLRPQNTYNPYKAVVESIAEMCKHYDNASHSGFRDFYDNVKVKCKDAKEYDKMFPQTQWKPSSEQMKALLYHCSNGSVLSSLYNDLKKLKEGKV